MKVKVCGLKHPSNIQEIINLKPHFVGFIFYEKSKRFVNEDFSLAQVYDFPESIQKVGVFVNSDEDYILSKVEKYHLHFVQLHGKETPELCKNLKEKGLSIIKAFSIAEKVDFENCSAYEPYCDYFLFDTKGKDYGGNGVKFDWDVLNHYKGNTPIFLSGGINADDAPLIKETLNKLKHINIEVLDINSKFEVSPALKDAGKVAQFIKEF